MVIVSACLAGFPCRWDGKEKANDKICELVKLGRAIPVCPEQLGGLTTPRDPSEIKDGRVITSNGVDVTDRFIKGAEIVLSIALKNGCEKAVLKSRSPSCGKNEIYDGSFSGVIAKGNGITANILIQNGIEVINEDEI